MSEAPFIRPAPPLDLRLAATAVCAWAVAFGAVSHPAVLPVLLGVTAFALVSAVSLLLVRGSGSRFVLVLVGVVLVLVSTSLQHTRAQDGGLDEWARQRVTVSADAVVRTDPRTIAPIRAGGAARVVVDVELHELRARGVAREVAAPVTVFADAATWGAPVHGTLVRVSGRLAPADPGDRSVALLLVESRPEVVRGGGRVQAAAERLRVGLRAASSGLPADARGLLPGLVVGDTSQLPSDLEDDMKAVGLTHLTAVSGSNTTLVVGVLVVAASWLGFGRRSRLVVAGVGLAGFVVLARPEPSVLRAAVMGGVGLSGLFAGRATRGVPVLSGAVLILLVHDPWLAREFGFILSVLATAGLLLFASAWAQRLQDAGVPRPVALALTVPTAAQVVCGPVLVLLQPSVNLVSIPANVIVAPAVAPATVLGLAATLVSPVWPFGATLLAWPAGLAAWWITAVARVGADLPTSVAVPAGATGAVVVGICTILLVSAVVAVLRLRHVGEKRRRWPALASVFVLLAVLLVRCAPGWGGPSGPWPAIDWRVVGCDVGQGDAVVLRSGPTSAVLVDAGPDDELVDGCLDRLGIRRLDAIVLTHFHADHVDGLEGAVRGREVGAVWVSPLAVEPAARRVRHTVQEAGAHLLVVSAGMTGSAGEVSWSVLAPTARVAATVAPDSSEVNDSSVALLAEVAGIRVLLAGDLERGGQARVLAGVADWPGGPIVDVVKVAHHGSSNQDAQFYSTLRPRVALIEVGAANDYGHPAAPTLALLAASGARTLRTDRDGDLAVAGTPAQLRTLVRGSDPRDAERRNRYGVG
ncbi:MAG: ComEC/Rec2 family competence protein [Janthinobacterium lividum]